MSAKPLPHAEEVKRAQMYLEGLRELGFVYRVIHKDHQIVILTELRRTVPLAMSNQLLIGAWLKNLDTMIGYMGAEETLFTQAGAEVFLRSFDKLLKTERRLRKVQ